MAGNSAGPSASKRLGDIQGRVCEPIAICSLWPTGPGDTSPSIPLRPHSRCWSRDLSWQLGVPRWFPPGAGSPRRGRPPSHVRGFGDRGVRSDGAGEALLP
eukprot:524081-Pyramimonas_sp.AAC.1